MKNLFKLETMANFRSKLKMFGKLMGSDVNKSAAEEKTVLNFLLSERCITIDDIIERTGLSESAALSAFENLDKKELIEYDRQSRCLRICSFKSDHHYQSEKIFAE